MLRVLKTTLNLTISFSLALMSPAPLWAAPVNNNTQTLSDKEIEQARYDLQLAYWAHLDHEMPEVAALGIGPDPIGPTWKITGSNSLLDSDPFFMRSQQWSQADSQSCPSGLCFAKTSAGVTIAVSGQSKALLIKQELTPILETKDYVFLSADNDRIFRAKVNGESEPGEGVFFIAKKDLLFAGAKSYPVPVFYFPLPDSGWVGQNKTASFEFGITDQVILYNNQRFGLPIDNRDIDLIEQVSRQNLVLAQTFSFLDGQVDARGIALPKPNSTLAFGLVLSGQTTNAASAKGGRFGALTREILPEANAADSDANGIRGKIIAQVKARAAQLEQIEKQTPESSTNGNGYDASYWKKWLINGVLYGGTAALAYAAYEPIDFSSMITADMPVRIANITKILGVVAVASVAMKYSIHKEHFDKLYPKKKGDSWLTKLNQEHKGIMSELAHGLYFSVAALPQGIRHALEFLKDHFIPKNKTVSWLWENTMGFQMRSNSQLAMNYKTQYLGWMFGFADSVMVGVYLLIFGPYVMNHFGLESKAGVATAAFASSEVLRNFLSYLQNGAHGYSSEVKFIHLKSAEDEARKQLRAMGINPDAARNQQELQKLTEAELSKRYKNVGLPGPDEFLYDPITVIEAMTKKSGYGSEAVAQFPNTNFVLTNRHWGMVQPALKKALQTAKQAYATNPSAVGAQTIRLLEWAKKDRSAVKKVVKQAWNVATTQEGRDGLENSIFDSTSEYLEKTQADKLNPIGASMAYVRGVYRYLAVDATKEVRDIREVLYLMSTTGNASDVMPYLPKSWRAKAGSDEAAAIGAELFHRAFFGYYEHDSQMITPDMALEAQYGARANTLIERFEKTEEPLRDPFVRKIRYWELLHRLKKKDEKLDYLLNYEPPKLSGKGRKQWEIVRAKATEMWKEQESQPASQNWLNVAQTYSDRSGVEIDPQAWSKTYRYRLLVAREFAEQVGLSANDLDQSEFVQKVVVDAANRTEAQVNSTREVHYRNKLNESDREFYEAQVFARNFIDSYVGMSVHTDEFLPSSSTEYPGRFQKIRKALVGKPGGKILTGVLRGVEAFFRNEKSAYQVGWQSFLERNVPLIPDSVYNFVRNLRYMPYFLTISYVVSINVWQLTTPYALWSLTFLIGFLNPTLVEINNRLQKNYGFKPMGDAPSKLLYGWIHSFLTNPEVLAMQVYAEPISQSFDRHVIKPITSIPSECADLLIGHKRRR